MAMQTGGFWIVQERQFDDSVAGLLQDAGVIGADPDPMGGTRDASIGSCDG